MAIHCFKIYYSKNDYLTNTYLPTLLTNWSAWSQEEVQNPSLQKFTTIDSDQIVECHGFDSNRFELEGGFGSIREDAEYIMSQLMGQTGYLASSADWWIIKWHHCVHDGDTRTVERSRELPDGSTETYEEEVKGCGNWKTLDSSDNYSSQSNVPELVK